MSGSDFQLVASVRATAQRCEAEGVGISYKTLVRWLDEGKLRFVPVGGRRYINWDVLMAFLAEGEIVDKSPLPYRRRMSRCG